MTQRGNVIVIGGGAIGCSAAYYLSKQGWRVRLLESGRVGIGCSHGNCGFICPSHVLPLTAPDRLWDLARKMFNKDSAVYIKPRFDPALWGWLVRFALRCRKQAMMEAASARHSLLTSSMKLLRQLLDEERLDVEWQGSGLLFVYKSPQEFAAYEKTAALIRHEFGIQLVRYEGSQLTKLEPALRDDLAGGWHAPDDAHLRPDRLMAVLVPMLRARGVEILEGITVTRIQVEHGRAQCVVTDQGSIDGNVFVLAAGAETPELARQLGCRIPIQPGKGYSITMPRPRRGPMMPMIFEEYHVAVTPWQSGLRVGSTMEFVGYDRSINRRRINMFQKATTEYLVEPLGEPIEEEWYGWRPMTYDELPCIGRMPKVTNVFVAAGHGMLGLSTMTATGKLVSELATGTEPHIAPAPYALERFSG